MSFAAIAGPAVEASATVRGIVGLGAQTFAGLKTFQNGLAVPDQGGANAVRLAGGGDFIRWGDAASGPKLYTGTFIGESALRYDGGPVVVMSAQGFNVGGINIAMNSGGMAAYSQSYGCDINQTQAAWGIAVLSARGASGGVVVKVGTTNGSPNGEAELLRVAHSLGTFAGSDGTAIFTFKADGRFNLAGGQNKEIQFGGVSTIYNHNDGGVAFRGSHNDSGSLAAIVFGNQTVLATADLVQFRNGLPSAGAVVARITPSGNLRIAGALGVGNSVAATGPVGNVVKKIQVYDAAGASLGFVPVYDAIT